jgi:hypothetical protein
MTNPDQPMYTVWEMAGYEDLTAMQMPANVQLGVSRRSAIRWTTNRTQVNSMVQDCRQRVDAFVGYIHKNIHPISCIYPRIYQWIHQRISMYASMDTFKDISYPWTADHLHQPKLETDRHAAVQWTASLRSKDRSTLRYTTAYR